MNVKKRGMKFPSKSFEFILARISRKKIFHAEILSIKTNGTKEEKNNRKSLLFFF